MSQDELRRPKFAAIRRAQIRRRERVNALQTKTTKQGTWRREAGIYSLLYGLPLLLLFPYTAWRPDGTFQAAVRTEAVDFTVGQYSKSGPFTCRCADVSLDRESFSKIILPAPARWQALPGGGHGGGAVETVWGGRVRFRHVDFQSLVATPGTLIKLRWNDKSPDGLLMRLTYARVSTLPAASIILNEKSSVEFISSRLSATGAPQSGAIESPGEVQGSLEVYPADVHLDLSVSPCAQSPINAPPSPHSPASSPAPQKPAALGAPPGSAKQPALPPADGIPLLRASGIAFITDDGDSGILEAGNSLEVKNADRKEVLFRGQRLEIAALKDRSASDHSVISLQVKDGILVNAVGRAGIIRIDGEDARPSLAEFLRAQKILSAWLATSILIGSALLTVVSRVKLVKLDDK